MNTNEQNFLKDVEERVGFSLSPEQTDYALGVLSNSMANAFFDFADADENAEKEEIRANYRELIRKQNRVVKG